MITPGSRGMGAHRAQPDHRDIPLELASLSIQTLPASVDLRSTLPPVWDQGQTSACTAYAALAGMAMQARKQGSTVLTEPSHTFTYFYTRKREGTQNVDNGANIRDALKSLATEGACGQKNWPDGNVFVNMDPHAAWEQIRFQHPPTLIGYTIADDPLFVAKHHRIATYRAVPQNGQAVRQSLANGFGVIFGVELYPSFWATGSDGMVPLPDPAHETLVGGHAMLIAGFREDGRFICRNSWGWNAFADMGYCYLPPNWFDGGAPCWDLWTVHAIAT